MPRMYEHVAPVVLIANPWQVEADCLISAIRSYNQQQRNHILCITFITKTKIAIIVFIVIMQSTTATKTKVMTIIIGIREGKVVE